MQLKPNNSFNQQWKNTILWTFIGCLFIFLIFNYQITTKQSTISALLKAFHPSPTCVYQQPSEDESSNNIIVNQTTPIITTPTFTPTPTPNPNPNTVGENRLVTSSNVTENLPETETTKTTRKKKCNFFEGQWVYHPEQSPGYDAASCPFFDQSLSCQKNGRPDSEYLKWRWEATDCDIPLFDARDMLERLRNKRVILVGDSLNRNQWQSLACLLYSSISDPSKTEVFTRGLPMFLKAKDYNFSLEFYMNPFLVEVNAAHKSGRRVLVLDKIAYASKKWKGADVMLFNSWHWWTHPDSIKGWDVYEYKGKLIEEMPREVAFARALKTWAKWIEKNVDSNKTTVLFRSTSATHYGKHFCMNSTQPIVDIESYKAHFPKPFLEAFDRQIKGMNKVEVKFLNITRLSEYRMDSHPSKYTSLNWKDEKKHKIDCSHWCLPGLPDTWNRLLYASLFFDN